MKDLFGASGDVDLLLDAENFAKARAFLSPLADKVKDENPYKKHLGMALGDWEVELHGTLRSGLWRKLDREVDEVQKSVFCQGKVRSWMNGKTQVFLPNADEDVVFVFSHIRQHFLKEGIGLRQVCDWCRLLWTYRDSLDCSLLESRIQRMGAVTEWKAFAALAVEYLGMPVERMPLYCEDGKWLRKASRICRFVLEVGNFGHKQRRDYSGMKYGVRKFVSFWRRLSDMLRHFVLFPKDSVVFFGGVLRSGVYAAVHGE